MNDEPNFNTHPDEWRAWRQARADAYVAAGHKTSFGFWRELHEDLEHGPGPSGRIYSNTDSKKKTTEPITTTFDPPIDISDLIEAAKNSPQPTYSIEEKVADLASFGLLEEQAVEPYLKLVAIHLAQAYDADLAGGVAGLDKAFNNWVERFQVDELTRITLEFESYISDKSEAQSWFEAKALLTESTPLGYAQKCYTDINYLFQNTSTN